MSVFSNASQVWSSIRFQLLQSKAANNAITYVYQQLSDDLGHVTIGLVPSLPLISLFGSLSFTWLCPLLVWVGWAYKECCDFQAAVKNNEESGMFPLDTSSLLTNIATALYYIGIGCALAYVSYEYSWSTIAYVVIGLLTLTSIINLTIELRPDMYLDESGIPYLSRLADFDKNQKIGLLANPTTIAITVTNFVNQVTQTTNTNNDNKCSLVIRGPLCCGSSSLAIAIANELAIAGKTLRYVYFDDIFAEILGDDNNSYWPIGTAQVVVFDGLPTLITGTDSDLAHTTSKLSTILPKLTSATNLIFVVDGNIDTSSLESVIVSLGPVTTVTLAT